MSVVWFHGPRSPTNPWQILDRHLAFLWILCRFLAIFFPTECRVILTRDEKTALNMAADLHWRFIDMNGSHYLVNYTVKVCPNEFSCITVRNLMAKWLEQASQWYEVYCHDLEVMSSNPIRIELGVRSTSVLGRTWIKNTLYIISYKETCLKSSVIHLFQPDSLELRGHLVMFQSTTLQGQASLSQELSWHWSCYALQVVQNKWTFAHKK